MSKLLLLVGRAVEAEMNLLRAKTAPGIAARRLAAAVKERSPRKVASRSCLSPLRRATKQLTGEDSLRRVARKNPSHSHHLPARSPRAGQKTRRLEKFAGLH